MVEQLKTPNLQAGRWITAFFTVRSAASKKGRNGRDYMVFELMRGGEEITGYYWGAGGVTSMIKTGTNVKVKGHVKNLNNIKLIQIKQIWPSVVGEVSTDIIYHERQLAIRAGGNRQLSLWPESAEDPALSVVNR